MSWGETAFAEPQAKATGTNPARQTRETVRELGKRAAIILDMGEASREQGFRMNGCR